MGILTKAVKCVVRILAATYVAGILQNGQAYLEDHQDFKFPNQEQLHPANAPKNTARVINPLWAPTSYLQGIDCAQESYALIDLNGNEINFSEYTIDNEAILQQAEEASLGQSIYVNENGHAIINFKAIGKPFEENKHEQGDGIIKDVLNQDAQTKALEGIIQHLLKDEAIKTIETVGFAQGAAKTYYLAEKYKILGTVISDTGTNFNSEHLKDYVIALKAPGVIHNFPFVGSTGEFTPAHRINLGDAHHFEIDQLYTAVKTSWVEKIQTLSFKFRESNAPVQYKDQGLTLFNRNKVCNNPTIEHE